MQIEFEKDLKTKEKDLIKNFDACYKDIKKELLEIYDKYEVDNAVDVDELRKYDRIKKLDDTIFSIIAENGSLNKKTMRDILNYVVDKTEKESLKTIEGSTKYVINPIKRSFDTQGLINKEVAGKAWGERLKHHTANFMYDVHGIVRQGLEQGDTYTTMAKNVKKKFGKEVKKELSLVRTEARRVQEFTKFETMKEVDKQVGLVKVWHTMKDEEVRSTHQAMEGVEVGMDEEFTLPSGATCLTPTGTGLPEEDCNCRCFIEYKVANDEAKVNDETEVEEDITENQGKYTKEEIDEALDSYVSGDGMWVNNNLRGVGEAAEYPLSEDDKIYIEKLDQATNNIVKEKTLYRSTDISSVLGDMSDLDYDNLKSAYIYNDKSKPAQEALEKYLKNIEGKEIVDKGFMSTTKSKDIALNFQDFTGSSKPCVIEFSIPKGIKGIDLKDFDIADMEQKEVLLARGQKFIIKEVRQEQGQFYFKADLIAENGYNSNTIADVKNFKEMTEYFVSKNITVDKTIKSLDFDSVKSTFCTIEDMAKKYPDAYKGLKKVTTTKEGIMSFGGGTINFNPKYYADTTEFKKICKEQSDTGWWPKNASIESIGAHEFGHSINFDLIRKNKNYIDIVDHAFDWNNDITATKIVNQACDDIVKTSYGKGKSIKELREAQSLYGASNPSEAVAEAFADIYANKGKANPLSIRIVEIIDDMLKNSGGN